MTQGWGIGDDDDYGVDDGYDDKDDDGDDRGSENECLSYTDDGFYRLNSGF